MQLGRAKVVVSHYQNLFKHSDYDTHEQRIAIRESEYGMGAFALEKVNKGDLIGGEFSSPLF